MGPGTAIVITDITIVKDLMDKRSQATIDRPPNYLADRVAGGMNMVLARYSQSHYHYLDNSDFGISQPRTGVLSGACRTKC